MKSIKRTITSLLLLIPVFAVLGASDLFNEGIYLIPYPQELTLGGEDFVPGARVTIVLDRNAGEQD